MDVAVKHGATLVIALNPLVPLVNDPRSDGSLLNGYRYMADHGMTSVVDQVFPPFTVTIAPPSCVTIMRSLSSGSNLMS